MLCTTHSVWNTNGLMERTACQASSQIYLYKTQMTIILPRNDFLILYSISVQIHCHRNKENKFHQIFADALASQPSVLSSDIPKLFECKFYIFHISDIFQMYELFKLHNHASNSKFRTCLLSA